MKNLTLSEIWIYPIKSLGGIRLDKARVMGKGLRFDRRWMLIGQDGVALTQRDHPVMALFKVKIESDEIFITYRKSATTLSTAHFSTDTPVSDKWINARIWDDHIQVLEVNRAISNWFSRHLGIPCKLISFPEKKPRPVDPRYSVNHEQVALADAYPFLIIGQGSLDDLNARLSEPVPMNRFRPNFVFTGGAAFAEDLWKDVAIGNIRFQAVKKCERCIIPTINQDTAEKAAEPLRTLSAYRKIDNKVVFGQNLLALDEGEVSISDAVIPA